jgi:uncharacterized membrane protein YgdD (TMEM256/DUF423 family)
MNARHTLIAAAIALASAVGFGAFGAHALRARLDAAAMAVYQTAVQYHFWHALGLLGVALLMLHWPSSGRLGWVAGLLVAGLVLFCGSLYALVLTGATWPGMVAPAGGLAFIAAWLMLAAVAWRHR